jgi:hypothetical protein
MNQEFIDWLCDCPVKFTSGEVLEDTDCDIKEYYFHIPKDDDEED